MGWNKYQTKVAIGNYKVITGPDGQRYQSVSSSKLPKGGFVHASQDMAVEGDTEYTISGQVWDQALVNAAATVSLNYFDAAGNMIGEDRAYQSTGTGSLGWIPFTKSIVTPSNAVKMSVYLLLTGTANYTDPESCRRIR